MIGLEDRELEQRFGEEYRAYRRRVPAVVPNKIYSGTVDHGSSRSTNR
jgi:protein-S-isoprenylcysteine O-methyltransferase Ste14